MEINKETKNTPQERQFPHPMEDCRLGGLSHFFLLFVTMIFGRRFVVLYT
jgi:hypothetical protein